MLPLDVYYSAVSSYCIWYVPVTSKESACRMLGSVEEMSIASLVTVISMQAQYLVCRVIVSKSEKLLSFN